MKKEYTNLLLYIFFHHLTLTNQYGFAAKNGKLLKTGRTTTLYEDSAMFSKKELKLIIVCLEQFDDSSSSP